MCARNDRPIDAGEWETVLHAHNSYVIANLNENNLHKYEIIMIIIVIIGRCNVILIENLPFTRLNFIIKCMYVCARVYHQFLLISEYLYHFEIRWQKKNV